MILTYCRDKSCPDSVKVAIFRQLEIIGGVQINAMKAMKIIPRLAGILGGLALIADASAQQVTNASLLQFGGTNFTLEVPTNNLLALAAVTGELRVLDSKGLILETNFVYLPRIKISDLSDSELHSLLETRTAYSALASFGPANERNAQSPVIENQLRQVWLQGKSLSEKIQTRLALLDLMRTYNSDLAYLPGSVAVANYTTVKADAANNRLALKTEVAANAADQVEDAEMNRAYDDTSRQSVHDAKWESEKAAESLARANTRAAIADNKSAAASQNVTDYINQCENISTQLAAYGVQISSSPPFYPVPSLSMRMEIDSERAGK